METSNQSLKSSKQGKYKEKSQRSIIFTELLKKPQNTKMLHVSTKIPREAITRRKRELQDEGLLWVIRQEKCPITNRIVQLLTTDIIVRDKELSKTY